MYTVLFINRDRFAYDSFHFEVPARESVHTVLVEELRTRKQLTPARYEWRKEMEKTCATLFTYRGIKFMKVEQTAKNIFEVRE